MEFTQRDSPRAQYEERLAKLQQDVLAMGGVVQVMLRQSVEAHVRRDPALVQNVIATDDVVDRYNVDIEQDCLRLLALQNPMAGDLRIIAAALKIITDVERMGDYCIDVAKTASRLMDSPPLVPAGDLVEMADIAGRMLRETLEAFVSHDLDLVRTMIENDDAVDHLNKTIHNDMVALVRITPDAAEQAIGTILMARYLERIADHITNVGERVYFMETGDHKELH